MEIIVQGHKIETKEIWDIQYEADSWNVSVTIKVSNKPNIVIGRRVPWECSRFSMDGIVQPYKTLYTDLKAKWDTDKTDVEIFKL